jgi:hypothetical protein
MGVKRPAFVPNPYGPRWQQANPWCLMHRSGQFTITRHGEPARYCLFAGCEKGKGGWCDSCWDTREQVAARFEAVASAAHF